MGTELNQTLENVSTMLLLVMYLLLALLALVFSLAVSLGLGLMLILLSRAVWHFLPVRQRTVSGIRPGTDAEEIMNNENKILNLCTQLKGMIVLASETPRLRGRVTDAIIHLRSGKVIGLLCADETGQEEVLETERVRLSQDSNALIAVSVPSPEKAAVRNAIEGGVRGCAGLTGSEVVTEEGELIGRICEIHVLTESALVIYEIRKTFWQRLFGHRLYLPGRAATAWLSNAARLIVPASAGKRFVLSSLSQAVTACQNEAFAKGEEIWETESPQTNEVRSSNPAHSAARTAGRRG